MLPLATKTVLVTGASRGIGKAIALAMSAQGARLALAARSAPHDTQRAIARLGGEAHCFAVDVSDESKVLGLFADLSARLGRLDVLVNNAGVMLEKPLLDTTMADFDRLMSINLRGAFMVGREALRVMHRSGAGGRVINIASDLGYSGREHFGVYCASKAAVVSLTKSWAKEFAPRILVNALCPGPVDTDMLDIRNMSAEWRRKEEDIPLGRIARPEEIAGLAVFLAGPGATFITGQGLGVNGGSVMP